jgi:hypothetical protein
MKNLLTISVIACLALAGCESKQVKVNKLQADYKVASKKYYDDCVAPNYGGTDTYFRGEAPKTVTPQQEAQHQQKCAQEAKANSELEHQIEAASK